MRTVNFSEARGNLKQVLDRVVDDADVTVITRRDAADVVVMSLDTWNSWRETEYLMASPANARRLLDSIARADAGKQVERDLIDPVEPTRVQEAPPRYRAKAKPGKRTALKSESSTAPPHNKRG
jgi:antitoxin YefM